MATTRKPTGGAGMGMGGKMPPMGMPAQPRKAGHGHMTPDGTVMPNMPPKGMPMPGMGGKNSSGKGKKK